MLRRARIGYTLDLLREGLGPFVERKIGVDRLDRAASLGSEDVRNRLAKFRVNDEWREKRFRRGRRQGPEFGP